jgi:hypothetical protein
MDMMSIRVVLRLAKFRSNLKIGIFGRDQDEAEEQPGGILKYVEDLRRGLNADTCPPPVDRAKRLF